MLYIIDIYIGSDNNTRKIGRDCFEKPKNWTTKVFSAGYTLLKGKRFCNGINGDSVIVTVLSLENLPLKGEIEFLKRMLRQEVIPLSKSYVDLKVF